MTNNTTLLNAPNRTRGSKRAQSSLELEGAQEPSLFNCKAYKGKYQMAKQSLHAVQAVLWQFF